jgi:hypothetical protein
MFKKTVQQISDADLTKEVKDLTPDMKSLNEIIEWCVCHWYSLAERIKSDRMVFDICKEFEKHA